MRPTLVAALSLAATLVAVLVVPALAHDQEPTTTVSRIDAGEATGPVILQGAVLERVADDSYWFSDGTGLIELRVDTSSADSDIPLFTLIGIEGSVADDVIEVTEWTPLEIGTTAVIVPEGLVIEAFHGWIIAYGGQAPEEPTE